MSTKSDHREPQFDPELLKMYLKMTPEQRLEMMYGMYKALWEIMPEKSKRAWEKLKATGRF